MELFLNIHHGKTGGNLMALLNLYKEKGSGSTGYATIKGLLKDFSSIRYS